jgi:hypothetical protein
MRSAAIQVEMDEFMTLRRLNLRIQGFPESYANEPYGDDMVGGEPSSAVHHHHPGGHHHPPMTTVSHTTMMTDAMDPAGGVLGSPIRSSPMTTSGEDPIPGAA